MRQLIYAMQFTGQAGPINPGSNVWRATTAAAGCRLTSMVNEAGLSGTLEPAAGGRATFESEVTFTSPTSFVEKGTIVFGRGNELHFSTVGQGVIGPSAEENLSHGAVMWKVERGEGQFVGATGLITSNFTVGAAGEVTDNHYGVLFVP
jgi:hypothetical protein